MGQGCARAPTVDPEALREFCRGRIAHFKVPRYVKLVDEFPMTVTGKVQKYKMREQPVEELGLTVETAETASDIRTSVLLRNDEPHHNDRA